MMANIGALRFHIGRMITICTSTPTPATSTMLSAAASASGIFMLTRKLYANMPPSITNTPCAKFTMPLAL